MRLVTIVLTGVVFLTGPAPVRPQGIGHGQPPVDPGQRTNSGSTTTTQPSSTQAGTSSTLLPSGSQAGAGLRLQTFGSWLDTAGVSAPGEAWVSISSAYWRSPSLREVDAPAVGVTAGVARRTQIGVSLPYYHVTDQSGFTSQGLGASYVTTKFALSESPRIGVSMSPTLEILNWSSPEIGRVNFVFPISLQTSVGATQIYGSTGYFTRGSVFGTGAVEWPATSKLTLAATMAHSYSVVSDPVSDALGIARHRTDGSGGVYYAATPAVVVFTSIGRTFAPIDQTSGRLAVSAGMTMNVSGIATRAPRTP
ncbi:MAG TPA: hypothetical protein VFU28_24010 [Vicinamibacterales bacterium]|nr:hypothetical protein [Vicinamibacterales bacterium]